MCWLVDSSVKLVFAEKVGAVLEVAVEGRVAVELGIELVVFAEFEAARMEELVTA